MNSFSPSTTALPSSSHPLSEAGASSPARTTERAVEAALRLHETRAIGVDRQLGNLLGIQPYMTPEHYQSEAAFTARIRGYFTAAQSRGWMGPKTIVVLPEYVASWLVVANEAPSLYTKKSVDSAMISLISAHLGTFFKTIFTSYRRQKAKDFLKYAIFRMKAETAGQIYFNSFQKLAREFGVTIVAGSIVLPKFKVKEDQTGVEFIGDELHNSTLIFGPDGKADPRPFYKVFPTPQELPYTTPGPQSPLPVYTTPAGRLGMLNCADSWYGSTFESLRGKIDFLAIPSFVEKDDDMDKPWSGKNITPEPVEFDRKDFQTITYDDAWIKYACPARAAQNGVKNVMNVFLRGKFWSLGSDGRSIIVADGKLERGIHGDGAAIQSLFL